MVLYCSAVQCTYPPFTPLNHFPFSFSLLVPQDLGMDLAIGSAEGEVARDTLDEIAGVEGKAEKSLMHRCLHSPIRLLF